MDESEKLMLRDLVLYVNGKKVDLFIFFCYYLLLPWILYFVLEGQHYCVTCVLYIATVTMRLNV